MSAAPFLKLSPQTKSSSAFGLSRDLRTRPTQVGSVPTTSTSSPSIGDSLIDNGTNLPVTGHNNQWIGISSTSAPGVVVYAVAVNSNGTIIGVTLCP